MGISRKMKDKNWTDAQGRKGKGLGVYRFADKYGVRKKNIFHPHLSFSPGFFFPGNVFAVSSPALLTFFFRPPSLPEPLKKQANVDGYSPIYTPDTWSESGGAYKLGTKGLVAWAGLIAVLLAVGANLIISTSQLGS